MLEPEPKCGELARKIRWSSSLISRRSARFDVPDVPLESGRGWRADFLRAVAELDEASNVEKGAAELRIALDEATRNPFVLAQLDEIARTGNPANVALIAAGQAPMDKGQSLVIDDRWSLSHVDDRHCLWLLQQWRFVRDCAAEWKNGGTTVALEALLPRLQAWAEVNLAAEALERTERLNWHDHATGLRAVNLIWLSCLLRASTLPEQKYLSLLFKLVSVHTTVLSAPDFYSKGTNHGFDQAYGLYFMSAVFPISPNQRSARDLGAARLRFEVACGFDHEGVHIENSPGYHVTMMARLLRAERLIDALEGGAPSEIERTIELAVRYLTYAWRPDGTVPLLGDSEAVPVRLEIELLKGYRGYDELSYVATKGVRGRKPTGLDAVFTNAGYAFLRDAWPTDPGYRGLHLAFKCGYRSQYHRHDDDNTILLCAFGEDWLVGSGIYKYHEQDELRKYVRSARAHNLMTVDDAPCGRNLKIASASMQPLISDGERVTVQAESNMFAGFRYTRKVTYARKTGEIEIVDVMQPADESTHAYTVHFHVPEEKELAILSPKRVRVVSRKTGKALRIELLSELPGEIEIACGRVDPPAGWTSPERGSIKPAKTIAFGLSAAGRVEVTSRLFFE